jgi:predicted ATPase
VEQAGQGEAYLPVLQALQQLCNAPDGDQVVTILRRYAPLWLLQLSGVIGAEERERLQRQADGCSPQRMLRELAQAMKELTAESPVLLFFDDLQWSDASTLDAIAYLAQVREPARLLVIGTYRPADTILSGSSLRGIVQQLNGRRQSQELALELLTQAEVQACLSHRLAGSRVVKVLGPIIYRRTEGNALFVTHFVDYLLQRGLLAETNGGWELGAETGTLEELIPDHVHQLLVKQIEGLSSEVQQLLEVASVVGPTFTAGEVAAVINRPLEAIEAVYDELAVQKQFLEARGLAEEPDGSVTVRYHFYHALYQHVLYRRIGLAQRVRWRRQLEEQLVRFYKE